MKASANLIWYTACALLTIVSAGCQTVHVTTTREVNRSVETTWEVFADADNLGSWMHAGWDRGVMDWADVDESAIGVPRMVRFVDEGEQMELTQTILTVKPHEEFRYTFDHEWADTDFHFYFEPTGPNKSTIRWEFVASPKGWHGVWMNLARGAIKARFNSHLNKLQALVENQPQRYP